MNKKEKKVVGKMIHIYCNGKHGTSHTLCSNCQELFDYANIRLDRCKFGEDKPTCEKCPVHCYKPEMKDKIQKVMRYAGPRMLWKAPIMAISHLVRNIRS